MWILNDNVMMDLIYLIVNKNEYMYLNPSYKKMKTTCKTISKSFVEFFLPSTYNFSIVS